MNRKYDSTKRKKAARQTREDILQAALKLHWEGITEFGPLAREAGCSVATLRKYFPSKESLFQGCTRTFAETLTMPDLAALGEIDDPEQRIRKSVRELCRIHEAMFGYAWLSEHQRKDSPTLDAEMTGYEGLTDAIVEIVTPPGSGKAPFLRGLLDFLSYRALRLSGKLAPDEVTEELIVMINLLMTGSTKSVI